jgi:WD40 repeat protein
MSDDIQLSKLPNRLVVVAGTYDGVLAGWDSKVDDNDNDLGDEDQDENENTIVTQKHTRSNDKSLLDMLNTASGKADEDSFLKMNFAMAVHDGSIRSLSIASAQKPDSREKSKKRTIDDTANVNNLSPDALISCGYDEAINMFSLNKQVQSGELKTPSDLGTPTCSSFAPPNDPSPTHVLIGLSSGKIVIYRKKDWSIQHILACHDDKGVNSIAVHPSGKMALSGGKDGKICLWDLMRGRLAFVQKISGGKTKGRKSTVNDIIWSDDGKRYAYCTHEGNITAREMETGNDLLDINLPTTGKPNQICFVGGDDGLFLAAACNDGGLPLFAVGSVDEEDEEAGTRRALMAIEPVDGVATAGDERFKCIRGVKGGNGFLVVTANSGGIISLIDLEGAARIMLDDNDADTEDENEHTNGQDSNSDSDDDEDNDVAAEILNSVRIGSGARVTAISVWSQADSKIEETSFELEDDDLTSNEDLNLKPDDTEIEQEETVEGLRNKKRKTTTVSVGSKHNEIEMDSEAIERARALVSQAKKREKRKKKKKKKKN